MISIKASEDGKQLVITADMDLEELPLSGTGKTHAVIKSAPVGSGFKIEHLGKKKEVIVQVTAYIKAEPPPEEGAEGKAPAAKGAKPAAKAGKNAAEGAAK